MALKLTQLAGKPQLKKILVDEPSIVEEFGEPIEFWIWDRQPIDKFVSMATLKPDDFGALVAAVNEMILDEEGNTVLKDGDSLPTNVMAKVINKVVETLGK